VLTYQDALWPTGTVEGERGCAERWAMLSPELPEEGILLDVGSNLGFYGISAVKERPGLAVVSLEADEAIAGKQAVIAAANDLDRILVLAGSLDAARAESWAATCDLVDCCLLLSIVHWFDDPARVLAALSRLSRRLIIELPDVSDAGACGGDKRALWGTDPAGWLRSVTGRDVRLLGRPSRHTSGVNSWLFAVDGPIERRPQLPYVGSRYHHPRGRDYRLSADAEGIRFSVRGVHQPWIAGVNVANLAVLGRCRYPGAERLHGWWDAARIADPDHLDPAPHNLLWGADGFVLIDGDDLDGAIRRPEREMRRFLRRWVRGGGYDATLLRRIGQGPADRPLGRAAALVPAPVKRRLRPLVRAVLFRLRGSRQTTPNAV
jgi:hypothetical protein